MAILSGGDCWVQAQERQLQADLQAQDRWLGSGDRGDGWRRYLQTDVLREQIALGDQANRAAVQSVLDAYKSRKPGLELPRFAAVRRSLTAWLDALPVTQVAELPKAARAMKSQFKAVTPEQLQKERADLDAALADLDQELLRGGISSAYKWKRELKWDELQKQLASETGPNPGTLRRLVGRFYQNQKGMEKPQFLAAREALRRYANDLQLASSDRSSQLYEQNLEYLAARLEKSQESLTTDTGIEIGRALGWMEDYGQATGLVSEVRQSLSHPNLFLSFSERMLNMGVEQEVDEQLSVRENIMGTSIFGTARMRGRVTLDLVSFSDHAAIDIVLGGQTYTNNVGYNGPVTVYTNGVTRVDARQRLMLDQSGLSGSGARATCSTRTNISKISAKSCLVRKIAWRRARATKGQAESIASRRAESRVAVRLSDQVDALVTRADEVFEDRLEKPLIRRDGWPSRFEFATTGQNLNVTMLEAASDQLAAPGEPPELEPGSDIGIRLHESFVLNMCDIMMAGVELTDERMAQLAYDLLGPESEDLEILGDDPWSITFSASNPIDVRFAGKEVHFRIRGERFSNGSQSVTMPAEVTARYRLETGPGGIKMIRQGNVEVGIRFDPPRGLDTSETAMKVFLQKKFETLFKPEMVSEGLALPGRWATYGAMLMKQLHCDDGWLVLGWQTPDQEVQLARRD
jgi:hypothetical protein